MRHFVSLIKRNGLNIEAGTSNNEALAHQINHELMNNGFVLSKDLFDRLATLDEAALTTVMTDIKQGLDHIVGGDGYVATYLGFPQSVLAISYKEFAINAILYYWTHQAWRPTETVGLEREFGFEASKIKELKLIEKSEFDSIFTDIIYSNNSISAFDKVIVDYFIDNGANFNFGKIKFKEIAAYVGQRLLDNTNVTVLPTKNATDILRIWAAYSGGDEGLKTNTKFRNPTSRQSKVILRTLESCYNLEDSFKGYREVWLRVLFYLHPMAKGNVKRFNTVATYTDKLRNNPKLLKTFNAKIEELLANEDVAIFEVLKKAPGVFTRRLDHLVRTFGYRAIQEWFTITPSTKNLVTAYNHFTDRDKEQAGRAAILAGQDQSKMVTYEAQAPLDAKVVGSIKTSIMEALGNLNSDTIGNKKVAIDLPLYYRPLTSNNRASNLSLNGSVNGSVEKANTTQTIRMYVHWNDHTDIDLSGFLITSDNEVFKVGWNGNHKIGGGMVYSGDNTGHSDKNAEYLDITPSLLPANSEWIIVDANIYSGPSSYAGYGGSVRAGWMLRDKPQAGTAWLPKTVANAQVLNSDSRIAYLMAYHVPTASVVYLDMSKDSSNVTNADDALKMRIFLDRFVSLSGTEEINWDKINQGQLLHLLAGEVVTNPEDADVYFSESTTLEEVSKFM